MFRHLACGGCRITLQYPLGAQSVQCSVCRHVNNPNRQPPASQGATPSGGGATGSPQQQQQQGSPKKPRFMVVVVNPPSLDAEGNEVANIAMGLKVEEEDHGAEQQGDDRTPDQRAAAQPHALQHAPRAVPVA